MVDRIRTRRTTAAGKVPNTSEIQSGELALNLTDKKLFSSDGSTVFEIGDTSFQRRFSTTKQVLTNGSYTHFANVIGVGLSAGCFFFLSGTSGSTVVCVQGKIIAHHPDDLICETVSGSYSQVELRLTNDNNANFSIQVKSVNLANPTNLTLIIIPFGNAVDFTLGTTYGNVVLHETVAGGFRVTRGDSNTSPNPQLLVGNNKVWHEGNDGIDSGLNADLLDNLHASSFLQTTGGTIGDLIVSGSLTVNPSIIIGGFGAETTGGVLDWNDVTNARSGNGHTLLLDSATNGFGSFGYYYHSFCFEYTSKNGTGNLTQLAIPYLHGGLYFRSRYSNAWTQWNTIWSSNNDGHGSGLDADLLDGYHASISSTVNTVVVRDGNGIIETRYIDSRGNTPNNPSNLSLGLEALLNNTASHNIAVGNSALRTNTSGGSNVAVGSGALYNNTTGYDNIAIGLNSLRSNSTGYKNLSIGNQAGFYNTTGFYNVSLGDFAGFYQTQFNNVFIGALAGVGTQNPSIVNNSVYIGFMSGTNSTSGGNNTFVGGRSGYSSTTGAANTMIGYEAGYNLTTGVTNTFIGVAAGYSVNGSHNIIIGNNTGASNDSGIIRLGNSNQNRLVIQGLNIDWTSSTTIWTNLNDGSGSGLDADLLDGVHASQFVRTDTNSTVTGDNYLNFGTNSTWGATLRVGGNGYTAGQSNTVASVVTSNGDIHIDSGGNKATYINYFAGTAGTYFGTGNSGTAAHISNTGVYTQLSDFKAKENITPTSYGLTEVLKLNPVEYNWKTDSTKKKELGLIAQEVQEVIPELVSVIDNESDTLGLDYVKLVPVLINAIKELKREVEELKKYVQPRA